MANSILKCVMSDYNTFRWLHFNFKQGKWAGVDGDNILMPTSEINIDMPAEPNERDEQAISMAIIAILSNEHFRKYGNSEVTFNPEEFIETINLLRINISLENHAEEWGLDLDYDHPDENGLPLIKVTNVEALKELTKGDTK